MWKKMRVVLLALVIALITLPNLSLAASGPTVTFGQIKGKTGEVVDVPVTLGNVNQDILSYGIEMNFDKASLEIVGVKDTYGTRSDATCTGGKEGCVWYDYRNTDGFIRVAWADPTAGDYPLQKDETLFTIQFVIKDSQKLDDKSLSIQVGNKEAFSFNGVSNNPITVGLVEQGKVNTSNPVGGSGNDRDDTTNSEEGKNDRGEATKPGSGESDNDDASNPGTEKNDSDIGQLPQTGDDTYIDTILNSSITILLAILVAMWIVNKRRKVKDS
jgi:hypothetical protein